MRILLPLVLVACWPGFAARQFSKATDTLVGGSPALPQTGTISLWANPQFAPGQRNSHQFFQQFEGPAGNYFQVMTNPQDMLYAAWKSNGTVANAIAQPGAYTLKLNAWNHLAATWKSGSFMKLYLNGREIASIAACPWISLEGVEQTFGNSSGVNAQSIVAEYGIWSRVLNAGEMALLGRGHLPSVIPNGLVEEYDLTGASLAAQAGTGGPLKSSGPAVAPDPPPPLPPSLSLVGPAKGDVDVQTTFFTVTEANLLNATRIKLSDGDAGGKFAPAALTLTSAIPASVFVYTPARAGNFFISIANDRNLADPVSLPFTAVVPPAFPVLTVDSATKNAPSGKDVTYLIKQEARDGYVRGPARLLLYNVPGKFNLTVNGKECGGGATAVRHFGWRACGVSTDGTYKLIVHTKGLAPGKYDFRAACSQQQAPNGSGVSLTLKVQ